MKTKLAIRDAISMGLFQAVRPRRFLSVATIAALLLIVNAAHLHAATHYVRLKNVRPGEVVVMRAGPGRAFKALSPLPYNTRHIWSYGCRQVGFEKWCRVRHLATWGWISGRYLANEKTRKI